MKNLKNNQQQTIKQTTIKQHNKHKTKLEQSRGQEYGEDTVDGIKFASNLCETFGIRFSRIFGIICISGGHQDLPPDFY